MSRILLSIIIPVYNVQNYIGECLDSLLCQKLDDCEIIVVNDGSTDNSLRIIEDYAPKFNGIVRIISQENLGLSSARNKGVKYATGEYIYFLDSDDYLKDFAIKVLLNIITLDKDTNIFQLDNIISDTGKRLNNFIRNSERISIVDYFKEYHTIDSRNSVVSACSFIYSSSFWRNNNLCFEVGKKYEDQLFLYNLLQKKGIIRVVHVDKPFYVFRENREGSISTNVTLVHYQDRQYIWRKAFQIFEDQKLNDKVYFNNLFKFCHWVLYEACKTGYINQYKLFFDSYDLQIMKYGISNYYERKIWLLIKINPSLMFKYIENVLPSMCRRLVNVCFTFLDEILPNGLVNTDKN